MDRYGDALRAQVEEKLKEVVCALQRALSKRARGIGV